MTLKQAKSLREGDLVAAVIEDPGGGESRWDPERSDWTRKPLRSGQILEFLMLIAKVRIVNNGPWHDSHDVMLLCRTHEGERAWLNIGNAAPAGVPVAG